MQQRLGRDTSDVQAHPAECWISLDQCDLQAQVSGAKRGRVATWPGSQHGEIKLRLGTTTNCVRRGLSCRGFRFRRALRRRRWNFPRRVRSRQTQDHIAFRHLLTHRDQNVSDLSGDWRGHVHRSLVALQRDQRILGAYALARLHVDFDDLDIGKVADVRHLDLH